LRFNEDCGRFLTDHLVASTVAAFPAGGSKRGSTAGRAEASRKASSDSVGNGKVAPFDEEVTPPPTVSPTKSSAAATADSKHNGIGGAAEGTPACVGAMPAAASALSEVGKLAAMESLSDVSSCDLDDAEVSEGVSELVSFSPRRASSPRYECAFMHARTSIPVLMQSLSNALYGCAGRRRSRT
jgi:hypothetical protein